MPRLSREMRPLLQLQRASTQSMWLLRVLWRLLP